MTVLKLNGMTIQNFKGVRDLAITFSGDKVTIDGRNGSGKSTLVDAFCWVLFNTDSKGNAAGSDNFREKPLDDNGQEIHYLDTMVTLDCTLDGMPFALKRVQREIWSKKRGFIDEVYGGNESSYWINGIETKAADFKEKLKAIAPIDVLEVLANLGEFNRRNWKERRTTLLSMCDSDIDSRLLALDKYRALADQIAETGVQAADQKKLISDRIKKINDELRLCPVRIDEATKALPNVGSRELADAQYMIKDAETDIDNINRYIAEAKARKDANAAHTQIAEREREAAEIKRDMEKELANKRNAVSAELNGLQQTKQRIDGYIRDAERQLVTAQKEETRLAESRERLLAEFNDALAAKNEIVNHKTCKTCGQPLPDEIINDVRQAVAERQAKIKEQGKETAKLLEEAKAHTQSIIVDIDNLQAEKASVEERIAALSKDIAGLGIIPDYAANARLGEIAQEITKLNSQDVADVEQQIAGYERRKAELEQIIIKNKAVLVKYESGAETQARIDSLKADMTRLGKELAETEKLLDMAENFIHDRCGLLTDSINALFPTVRWKLFNTQINGGIADVCTCLIPCESGLVAYESANTAAQICADIEIIKALSDYFGVKVPLFIDQAERINSIPDAGTQTITLAVSTADGLNIRE